MKHLSNIIILILCKQKTCWISSLHLQVIKIQVLSTEDFIKKNDSFFLHKYNKYNSFSIKVMF